MPNHKRKRKRVSESEKTPVKRAKRSTTETPKTPKTPKSDKKAVTSGSKKKFIKKAGHRRKLLAPKRRRLNGLREKVTRSLERALVEAPKIPLIYHLFTERDSMGTPKAPLRQVLRTLKISDFVKDTHFLRDSHMKSLSNFTTLFAIEEDEGEEGIAAGLYLKYWPIYDKEAATVYVDNLPEGCCEAKLMRLANCYGTVAELSLARKGGRWIRPKHHPKKRPPGHPAHRHIHRVPPKKKQLINVGSRPKAFGFIRFVDKDSATNMIRDFIVNDPSVVYQKLEEKWKREVDHLQPQREVDDEIPDILIPGDMENLDEPVVPQEFPRPRPFVELYMTKLIREIRFLKMRRKRRPWPMYMRLRKLERRFHDLKLREYGCLRKAGILQPRKKIRKSHRIQIHQAFAEDAAVPSCSTGRAPPPPSRQEEQPSTSDGQTASDPLPYVINIQRSRNKKSHHHKKKKKKKPKRKDYTEKYVNGVLVKKKKRKRKKMCRKLAKYVPGGQVRRFFQNIQVFSLKKYLEMKEEYKELVRKEKERVREEAEAPPAPELEPQPDPDELEAPDMEF